MERSHSGLSCVRRTPRRFPEIEKIDVRHSQSSACLLMTALQREAHAEIKQVVRGSPTLFARGHPDAAPAIAEARVEASAKVQLLSGPPSHDSQDKAKSSSVGEIFRGPDDGQRSSASAYRKPHKLGSSGRRAPELALAARRNIHRPDASWCSSLHIDRAQGPSRVRSGNTAPAVFRSLTG